VREAVDAGHRVVALPGPSAPLAALASAGLPTDTFLFAGFLPPKSAARKARLAQLKDVPATLVLFEAPSRLAESLTDIGEVLGTREAAVARELTKLYEEVRRGTPAELARWATDTHPKGEMVILIGPPLPAAVTDADIAAKLTPMLPVMSLSDAAKAAAENLGVSKGRVYEIGVALKGQAKG
jgi:16S rRNA (cytidine1402-2'-O)-methyltransferase